jgi:hypothetical protein
MSILVIVWTFIATAFDTFFGPWAKQIDKRTEDERERERQRAVNEELESNHD